ncbi:MAG: tryptophan synthase subunit alpha [Acidobacteriota bacterium]
MPQTRIQKLFERTRSENRAAFIAYLTAGDPTPEKTPEVAAALLRGGADLIELGVPFSDPVADGPVIQRASARALNAGTTMKKVLEIAKQIRATSEVPLVLFTYLNPVIHYGLDALARDAKAAGIDGVLLTDLSVEEAGPFMEPLRAADLDTVFLAAPTSTERRLKLVAEYSRGFVYLVSRTGVTGERAELSDNLGDLIASVRAVTNLPLAAGFGFRRRIRRRPSPRWPMALWWEAQSCGRLRRDVAKLEPMVRGLAEKMGRRK